MNMEDILILSSYFWVIASICCKCRPYNLKIQAKIEKKIIEKMVKKKYAMVENLTNQYGGELNL